MSDAVSVVPRTNSVTPIIEGAHFEMSSSDESELSMIQQNSLSRNYGAIKTESRSEKKMKRKRTSLHDQSIPQLEHSRNTQPTKITTAKSLEVSRSEKEVQIWHRNQCQVDRSKSRTGLTQANFESRIKETPIIYSDPINNQPCHSNKTSCDEHTEHMGENSITYKVSPPDESDKIEKKNTKNRYPEKSTQGAGCEQSALVKTTPPPSLKTKVSSGMRLNEATPNSVNETVIKSFSSTPSYLANRWNHVLNSVSTPLPESKLYATSPMRIESSMNNSSPKIRLSLSLDGKAELVTESPSSQFTQNSRPKSASGNLLFPEKTNSLQIFQSSPLPCAHSTGFFQGGSSPMPRRPVGRSRDARSWAFCCYGECRDELTRQAENESHGSAVAAISLIRSAGTPVLKSSPKKRCVSINTPEFRSVKKSRLGSSKILGQPKHQTKSTRSMAREPDNSDNFNDYKVASSSGDSDKENWLPQQNGSPRRRPLPSSRQDKSSRYRKILGSNENLSSDSTLGGCKRRFAKSLADSTRDYAQRKPNGEVENFVNAEVSPSKIGDLGAIQGLLSLSQGNWRQ